MDAQSRPKTREQSLLVETIGEELLLYDENSHTAHCLSPIAACVWRHCDGAHDVSELAEFAGVSQSLVADALSELHEKDLLDAEPQLVQGTFPGISRREAIIQGVRVGAAAAAVPLIVSATAATPAMASSGTEVLTPDTNALEFGEVARGTKKGLKIKYTNNGSAELHLKEVEITSKPFYKIGAVDTCKGKNLAKLATCEIEVEFSPTEVGEEAGFANVLNTSGFQVSSVILEGKGK